MSDIDRIALAIKTVTAIAAERGKPLTDEEVADYAATFLVWMDRINDVPPLLAAIRRGKEARS